MDIEKKLEDLNKKLGAKQISKNCFELPSLKMSDGDVKSMEISSN